jgi:hypothetical protein
MALFKSVNSPLTIKFTATSAQTGAATLRIGTTLSFAGGRPQVTVNSYSGSVPSAPANLDSRGATRGAYRGFGEVYDVGLPGGSIVAGTNTVCFFWSCGVWCGVGGVELGAVLTGVDYYFCCFGEFGGCVFESEFCEVFLLLLHCLLGGLRADADDL